eukprot:COSAG02_NODE_7892_length_2802_cov_17.610063_2_plen_167_part_00
MRHLPVSCECKFMIMIASSSHDVQRKRNKAYIHTGFARINCSPALSVRLVLSSTFTPSLQDHICRSAKNFPPFFGNNGLRPCTIGVPSASPLLQTPRALTLVFPPSVFDIPSLSLQAIPCTNLQCYCGNLMRALLTDAMLYTSGFRKPTATLQMLVATHQLHHTVP